MLAQSPVAGDARVVREAVTLRDAGYEVTVVGRGVPGPVRELDGVTVLDAGRARGLGSASGSARNGLVRLARQGGRWLLLPEHRDAVESAWTAHATRLVRAVPADVVHAHDRNTLGLGVAEAERRGVPLVYDAHELWSDRPLPGRPTPLRDRRDTRRETRWASKASAVLTVSEGLAGVLRGRGLPKVHVVRNSFPSRLVEPVPPDAPKGVVYAGRVAPGRDLETVLAAAPDQDGLGTLLIGPVDPHYAARLRLPASVQRRPALAIDDVDDVLAEYGIAAITAAGHSRNHLLGLPNKLFHAVRAGVPVVAADLPEQARVITEHGIGTLYRPGDVQGFVAATRAVRERYGEMTEAVKAARRFLSWDTDGRVLLDVYARLR